MASTATDPVSTGLNSVTITNGEGKPAPRYADVSQATATNYITKSLTKRQTDRH